MGQLAMLQLGSVWHLTEWGADRRRGKGGGIAQSMPGSNKSRQAEWVGGISSVSGSTVLRRRGAPFRPAIIRLFEGKGKRTGGGVQWLGSTV